MKRTVILLVLALGCDHTTAGKGPPGVDASSGVDTHDEVDPPDSSSDVGSDTECRGSLADVGQVCPATFDGAPENVPACERWQVGDRKVWSCDGFLALSLGIGTYRVDCYYDPSSDLLVGAMGLNDTNTFCGNSFAKTAGQTPSFACRVSSPTPTYRRVCLGMFDPDAGAD